MRGPGNIGYPSGGLMRRTRAPASAGFPGTMAALNAWAATWGVTFAHAWNFDEASGNAIDLATSGGINLVPTGTPTQNVATGLAGDVAAVQMADNSGQRMAASAAGDLDVTTGSLIILTTRRFVTTPAATRNWLSKIGTAFYTGRLNTNGSVAFAVSDGTDSVTATVAGDHVGAAYRDILVVLDKDTVADAGTGLSITTDVADSGIQVVTTVDSITNTGVYAEGRSASGAGQIVTFTAWGTVVGTAQADRAAMLASWRTYRGA